MPVTSGCIYSAGSVLGTTKVKSYNRFASTNLVTIDAKLMGGKYIDDEGVYHYVSIVVTSGQTLPLVSGTPDRRIEVQNYTIDASGATGVSFLSSGTVVTTISGPMSMSANGSITNSGKSMKTVTNGDALSISSSLSTVTGSLSYRLV